MRHLVMPGLIEETEAILRFVAEELGMGCYMNLTAQYYVSGKGRTGRPVRGQIARRVYREKYEQGLALARELGLRLDPPSVADRHELPSAA